MQQHALPSLRPGRVHEAGGPSAAAFAAIRAAQSGAQVLWISPAWLGEQLLPDGLAGILPPERLLITRTAHETDTLAVAEEALRDGALPFVVLRLTVPLSLREGRRLQLAAKEGRTTGLCLIPEGAGSNSAETRWHCSPVFDEAAGSTLMRWEATKNKQGTYGLGAWHVRWNGKTHRLDVVPPAGPRAGAAGETP